MDHHEEANLIPLINLVQSLHAKESHSELATELETLQAILGEHAVHCLYQAHPSLHNIQLTVHLQVNTSEAAIHETDFDLQIHIPDHYPNASEIPTVDLLACYIGPFKVDPQLLQSVKDSPSLLLVHDQLLYDLISNAKDIVEQFYLCQLKLHHNKQNTLKNDCQPVQIASNDIHLQHHLGDESPQNSRPPNEDSAEKKSLDFTIHSSQPIVDRRSTFVGHSIALEHPNLVPSIIQQLLGDKKVAKASHNIVAWRCDVNGCLHQDHDDDGESAAGSRMLHLLSILNVKNVLVCVSRWFGGIHLGADRFKHINQATRDALTIGGFISSTSTNPSSAAAASNKPLQNQAKSSRKFKKKE